MTSAQKVPGRLSPSADPVLVVFLLLQVAAEAEAGAATAAARAVARRRRLNMTGASAAGALRLPTPGMVRAHPAGVGSDAMTLDADRAAAVLEAARG